jgi:GNAT superfamily N-acetyltransferase
MDQEYRIVYEDHPEESAWGIIGRAIGRYNVQHVGEEGFQRLCFVLQAPDQEVVGGVIGEVYWDWLHVDLLWVREDLRGRGYGRRLLACVEDKARECGAKHAHLDTFNFQAPDFYEKYGYEVYGTLDDCPVSGRQRHFMTKPL